MFKPGFFGKNPSRFWIGQVPLNQLDNKINRDRWGDRVKVRIIGYHPSEGSLLADEDLPWAVILKPTSQGSLNRGSTAIIGGEWVMGIFLDDHYEKPLIIGVLGRSEPSYEMTQPDAIAKKSSEFLTTLNYFGTVLPTDYQTLGGTKDQSSKKAPTVPSAAGFGLKSDSEAKAGTTAQEAATAAAEAEQQSAAGGTNTATAQEAAGGTDTATAQEAVTEDPNGFVEFTGEEGTTSSGGGSSRSTTQTAADVLNRDPQSISQYGTRINNTPTVEQLEQLNSSGLKFTPNPDGSPGGRVDNPNSLLGG